MASTKDETQQCLFIDSMTLNLQKDFMICT